MKKQIVLSYILVILLSLSGCSLLKKRTSDTSIKNEEIVEVITFKKQEESTEELTKKAVFENEQVNITEEFIITCPDSVISFIKFNGVEVPYKNLTIKRTTEKAINRIDTTRVDKKQTALVADSIVNRQVSLKEKVKNKTSAVSLSTILIVTVGFIVVGGLLIYFVQRKKLSLL